MYTVLNRCWCYTVGLVDKVVLSVNKVKQPLIETGVKVMLIDVIALVFDSEPLLKTPPLNIVVHLGPVIILLKCPLSQLQ